MKFTIGHVSCLREGIREIQQMNFNLINKLNFFILNLNKM